MKAMPSLTVLPLQFTMPKARSSSWPISPRLPYKPPSSNWKITTSNEWRGTIFCSRIVWMVSMAESEPNVPS